MTVIVTGEAITRARRVTAMMFIFVACTDEPSWSGEIGSADQSLFDREVYPILLRDCAHNQCHGAPQRFLQVFGPGRARLRGPWFGAELLAQERRLSYERALSMLITDGSRPVSESRLLMKPLEPAAGGASHGGVDLYGRNVYRSSADPAYAVLVRWAGLIAVGPSSAGSSGASGAASSVAIAP
jgi:hypothetical protein